MRLSWTLMGASALAVATLVAVASAQDVTGHDKMVGCYFGAWAFYRPGYGKWDVDDFDPFQCTHGFYGFADLDNVTWTIYAYDPWYDLDPELDCPDHPQDCMYNSYRRFVALKDKNPDFVPMLSIGGWNAGSGKYSIMAKDPAKRKTFIESTVEVLIKFGFEGVDLDWEYPGSREGADEDLDKENFNFLVDEFRTALDNAGSFLFSAAVSPSPMRADIAYDIPYISERFDFMNIMTYDYHGWWENHSFTGHNSPTYRREEENIDGHPGYMFNQWETMQYWIEKGAPVNKLALGGAAYGRGFQLEDNDVNGIYCPADDGIPMGAYTRQKGFWGYLEILQAQQNDTLAENLPDATPKAWTVVVDDCYKSPYMHNGPYWIGYDDEESIAIKVQVANYLKLAGVFVWSIDTDDFAGRYSSAPYPLSRVINRELADGKELDPTTCTGTADLCDIEYQTTSTTTTTTTTQSTSTTRSTTTTSQSTTTTSKTTSPNPGTGVCKEDNDLIKHPFDCRMYIRCDQMDNGEFTHVELHCGEGHVFDEHLPGCIEPTPENVEELCGEDWIPDE